MSFTADKQTIADLNLLGKHNPNSVYSIFNHVCTGGGERLLLEMFRHPLNEPDQINQRTEMFRYFQEKNISPFFQGEVFGQMEVYLSSVSSSSFLGAVSVLSYQKLASSFLHDERYDILHAGLLATVEVLNSFREFLFQTATGSSSYDKERKTLREIFSDQRLRWLAEEKNTQQFSLLQVIRYGHQLQHTLRKEMEMLLDGLYRLDVYLAVGKAARLNDFHYAVALPKTQHQMHVSGLRHPALTNGVANNLSFRRDQNMLFLTGANMAGKSTFMKAWGIAVYLAHMGFPVAAQEMVFSVCDGIYSSINVSDDLNMGYSHFYAEVLRVKNVALEVSEGRNLIVLFDELFKGTNVKDAYDGTLAVTEAFSKYRNCFYIVSTHIIEVGNALAERCDNVRFAYLPTIVEQQVPRYTYLLEEGITADRQGMMLIRKEGIIDIITGHKT